MSQLVRVDDRADAVDMALGHPEDQHGAEPALAVAEQVPGWPLTSSRRAVKPPKRRPDGRSRFDLVAFTF
jgi:hypothetical protein